MSKSNAYRSGDDSCRQVKKRRATVDCYVVDAGIPHVTGAEPRKVDVANSCAPSTTPRIRVRTLCVQKMKVVCADYRDVATPIVLMCGNTEKKH